MVQSGRGELLLGPGELGEKVEPEGFEAVGTYGTELLEQTSGVLR